MNYAALKAEIALPAYAGKSDAEIVAILQAPLLQRVPIDRKQTWTLLMGRGAWPRLRLIAEGRVALTGAQPDEATLLEAVVGAVDQITREDTTAIDATSDADWGQLQQMLGLFVLNGALTKVDAAHMRDILALGVTQTTRAQQIGCAGVNDQELLAMRKLNLG